MPAQEGIALKQRAKALARQATERGRFGQVDKSAKATVLGVELAKLRQKRELPKYCIVGRTNLGSNCIELNITI